MMVTGRTWTFAATLAAALVLLIAPPIGTGAGGDSITSQPPVTLAAGGTATLPQTLHLEAAPPTADILLAFDTTASMGSAITDAKADAVSMVNQIKSAIPGARFAVADFKDYPNVTDAAGNAVNGYGGFPFGETTDYPWQFRLDFTPNDTTISCPVIEGPAPTLTPLECALRDLNAGGGFDEPEAYNRAFFEAYNDSNLHYRDRTPRFMIVLGDSLPHDAGLASSFPSCPNLAPTDPGRDSKVGTSDDLSTLAQLTALKNQNTNVSFVTYNPHTIGGASVAACHADLAQYTGGSAVTHGAGAGNLGSQIVSLIQQAAAHIDTGSFSVTSVSGPAGPVANPSEWFSFDPSPFGPTEAPVDIHFDETINVPQAAAVGQYVFDVAATADSAVRAHQTITVNVVNDAVSNVSFFVDDPALPAGIAIAPFNKIPASRIPFFSGATGNATTPYGATPYGATPFGATPFGATPYGATPWGATPYGATPYGATPYGATPFGATPWGATPWGATGLGTAPFGATPYGATDARNPLNQVLLSQIPLSNPGDGATWPQVLANSPLAAKPLSSSTLGDVAADTTVYPADNKTPWQRFSALPARDVAFLASIWQGVPVGAIVLGNATLGQIPNPAAPSATAAADRAAAWARTIKDSGGCDGCTSQGNTFFGIAAAGALGRTDIGSIPFGATPYGATAGGAITLATMNVAGTRLAPVPLSEITTLSDIVDCNAFACGGKTLGDVPPSAFKPATGTLAKLFDGIRSSTNAAAVTARAMTVDEIVAAVLPFTAYPWEQLPLQGLQDVVGTGKNAHYHVKFDLSCSITHDFRVSVDLPVGFFPVPGSSAISFNSGTPQTVPDATLAGLSRSTKGGAVATWPAPATTCSGTSATLHAELTFTAFTGLTLGDQASNARVTALGVTHTASDHAPVLVTQNHEPNDDPATAPQLAPDQLVVGHVASAGDTDYFRLPLDGIKTNSQIVAFLNVPSGADLDLTMNEPSQASVQSTPFGATGLGAVPVPDQKVAPDNSGVTPQANTLADVPFGATPWGATPFGATASGSISQNRGSDPESAAVVVHQQSGGFLTLGVSGYAGSFSAKPYVLRVEVIPPPPIPASCPPVKAFPTDASGVGTLPSPSSLPQSTKTLFLVNRQRMATLYPSTVNSIMTTSGPGSQLAQLAGRSPDVNGAVLSVDANGTVRNAYQKWDQTPCSPDAANGVVRSINDLLQTYRAALPNLRYVVLLGTDTVLPMYRLQDSTVLSPELNEAQDLAFTTSGLTKANPLYAAAAQDNILTDGAYGAFTKVTWLDHDLPLPQLVVSRLVETPDDIVGQVSQYLSSNGVLDAGSALTTGYDFLADGADATNRAFGDTNRLPGLARDTQISHPVGQDRTPDLPLWTRDDLISHFFGKTGGVPAIGALFGHYNHYAIQPVSPSPITNINQVGTTADAANRALAGHVIFTVGCHAGLNVPDELAGATTGTLDPQYQDWAQAYDQGKAILVANTGYGYGDTDTVAASERLMALFANNLNAGSSYIGDNWLNALTTYFGTTGIYSAIDEKVMLEATFYGLPFYHFGTQPTGLPGGGVQPTSDGTVEAGSYPSLNIKADRAGTGTDGTSNSSLAVPYRPIEPLVTKDVSVAGKQGRGAWVTALSTTDHDNVTPTLAHWIVDDSHHEPRPNFENSFWPASPAEVLRAPTLAGDHRSFLNINAGAFMPRGDTGTQRDIDRIGVDVTYSSNASDQAPPLISQATSVQDPNDATKATIYVRATDAGSGIHKVAVLYNDGTGTSNGDGSISMGWTYVELTPQGGGVYTKTVSGLNGLIEFGVEAMDNTGWVGHSWDKAFNFHEIIDSGSPTVLVEKPVPGETFTLNQQVRPDVDCSDAGGVASCSPAPLINGNLDTSTIGPHTLTITSTDISGNQTQRQITYRVIYKFVGFNPPVDNPPVLNVVNAGSTVPVKWALFDAKSVGINALSTVQAITSKQINCSGVTDPDAQEAPLGTAGLKIDNSGYQYNWATSKSWSGTCRRFRVYLSDEQKPYADFKFK